SLQCLSTQTRFGLNPIIFVIDNGVFGVEQWLHRADELVLGNFSKECIMHRWNYAEVSRVFTSDSRKCEAWKATTYGELKAAIESALANTTSPSLIQVVVEKNSIPRNAEWK